ncbi:hypothetical protein SADUNF_Sadunf10G0170700 [Salix dunnii]|uniref:Uncharacterized protein n=1 Tax=Salix dunnii TaxID=1413687 RepID=A0A835MZ34_9ROSI|nr:hypothetical protein SADUNF_Sadunf10G0170700 [Salix dunnii]
MLEKTLEKSSTNHLLQTSADLFKKANTVCGVDIAMIVDFSPAQEAFSSGHPNIGSIMDWFLTGNPSPSSPDVHQLIELPKLGTDLETDTASTALHHFSNFGYAYGLC